MDTLIQGAREFQKRDFHEYKERFEQIATQQNPHTLFITCCDSRVVPSLITKTIPGELFIVRNIANIVPYYRLTVEYVSTTSAIEYAVQILNVQNIIICGHSDCGGCGALFYDDDVIAKIPNTQKWLELAKPVKERIEKRKIENSEEKQVMTEKENVLEQIEHLKTYPYIKDRCANSTLKIMGWYYMLNTGEIQNYDYALKKFIQIV